MRTFDCLRVVHDCFIIRSRNINGNLSCFQHGSCDYIENENDDESGFDRSAENFMDGPHCIITEEDQVSLYFDVHNGS